MAASARRGLIGTGLAPDVTVVLGRQPDEPDEPDEAEPEPPPEPSGE